MSFALSPGRELLPYVGGMTLRSKIIATFSRHTGFPMFIGMTADQCDILVSLSPNLTRFFSRISTDARSIKVNRSRYCLKVSDPIIILAHPVSMIPFPGLEFSIASYSPKARSRSIFLFPSLSPAMNNAALGVCESCPAESGAYSLPKKHRKRDSCCGLQSQK